MVKEIIALCLTWISDDNDSISGFAFTFVKRTWVITGHALY